MRTENLPRFRYHPDPVATGAIRRGEGVCECCGKARGYVYGGPVYAEEEVEAVCPWCIADGTLHRMYSAILIDDSPLLAAGLPTHVVEEVTQRTPGYESWQQERWLDCCGDACEFHGNAPQEEIKALDREGIAALSDTSGLSVEFLRQAIESYEPGGNPAFYKFVCRHCRRVKFGGDYL